MSIRVSPLSEPTTFNLVEATIDDIDLAFEFGALTAKELVQLYLNRIEAYDDSDPAINSIINLNPHALETAKKVDRQRFAGKDLGTLAGIPVILKDNYDASDVQTTAGAIALEDFIPEEDAFQVAQLRDEGAIILAKANLSEFAFSFETTSSLGGTTLNPYDPERNAGGSSGGTGAAIAANFGTIGTGTDTGGSIRIPSTFNSLVGIRPTIGLTSRSGIIPLALTQDVGGPITRTVTDGALTLDALAGFDPEDPITASSIGQIPESYTNFLDSDALDGARIGVVRELFGSDDDPRTAATNAVVDNAIAEIEALGATAIDVEIPNLDEILEFPSLSTLEFKRDLNNYLAERDAPIADLEALIESGEYLEDFENAYIARNEIDLSDPETAAEYQEILTERPALTQSSLLEVLDGQNLDALIYPTAESPPNLFDESTGAGSANRLSPFSGFPAISVPAGFTEDGLPVGIEFLGRAFSEPTLIGLTYSFEQGTQFRMPPESTPSLEGESFEYLTQVAVYGDPENNEIAPELVADFDGNKDLIFAGAGDDLIDTSQALTGENRLYGGAGDDELIVGLGDRAFGDTGDDLLDASVGRGQNRLYGGAGNDDFFLGSGDRAWGGQGDDRFFAISGGDNHLSGGMGADQFWIANAQLPEAVNTITDFEIGEDVIGIGGFDLSFAALSLTQQNDNTLISTVTQDLAVLVGIQAETLGESDFVLV
ncbi:Amidase, Asp-tRNAAsn/Glu-tRNAGln amidotransferase A subunit [Hyella patelloides LEGE 07179]|uniref:Amidase, Asp-tRNAAsn/Glu-tRNAGln amidotransferase A subunit n=1 Tax=Hyella patelloides LEGE 07179 TaxID=945734 RepID=A0A563VXS4_9CYAN|nr:amidase family protein [Hyella patelloides]VEP16073.1 Amidase, Asp-tRNAAsn/Glu-tRNAGln amidotransferase A subunit [Hyella patelloides LEGE 07179]